MRNADGSVGIPPTWKRLVEAALLELDPEKVPQRIEAAQRALLDRVEDLHHAGESRESQALANAMNVLGSLETWLRLSASGTLAQVLRSQNWDVNELAGGSAYAACRKIP